MIPSRIYSFDVVTCVLVARLRSCEPSEQLRTLVRKRGIHWERVIGHASANFVLPAFAAALHDLGLSASLDQELGAFLDAVPAANEERNIELRDELAAAVGVLNRADIEPVLLKGAIRLMDGLYPDHGWRLLSDLDLLVPEASLADAQRALQQAGYDSCGSGGEVRRPGGACQIDLHTELFCTPREVRLLPAANVLERARRATVGSGGVRIPSVQHQLVHLIGHGQIRHLGHAFGRISLRNRLEAAALAQWGCEAIDWRALSRSFSTAGYSRTLLCFLLTLQEDGWCAVPSIDRIDRLTALQRRRIVLQARSPALTYVGSRLGSWISALISQFEESEGAEFKAISNLRKVIFERGAARRMARAFLQRQRHLLHVSPYLSWLINA